MKCYKTIIPSMPAAPSSEAEVITVVAKRLGSSIADGRYNGVCDGSAGLLSGQYDNDSSLSVDPLCDLSTDVFGIRTSSTPSPGDHQTVQVSSSLGE